MISHFPVKWANTARKIVEDCYTYDYKNLGFDSTVGEIVALSEMVQEYLADMEDLALKQPVYFRQKAAEHSKTLKEEHDYFFFSTYSYTQKAFDKVFEDVVESVRREAKYYPDHEDYDLWLDNWRWFRNEWEEAILGLELLIIRYVPLVEFQKPFHNRSGLMDIRFSKFYGPDKKRIRPETTSAPPADEKKKNTPVGLFALNYGDRNAEVIRTLYDGLNGRLFNASFEQWERLFTDNEQPLQPIEWQGREVQLVTLFQNLNLDTSRIYQQLATYFRKNNGQEYNPDQMPVSYNKAKQPQPTVSDLIEKVNRLVRT